MKFVWNNITNIDVQSVPNRVVDSGKIIVDESVSSTPSTSSLLASPARPAKCPRLEGAPGKLEYEEGMSHFIGLNFKKINEEKGQQMIEKSASKKFPMAQAQCLLMGWGGKKENEKNAKTAYKDFLQIEKSTSYHWAQCMLAECYLRGDGIAQMKEAAVSWYIKSAEQGNSSAMQSLAAVYCTQGTKKRPKILELCKRSANLGCADAMQHLGCIYQSGWKKDAVVSKDVNTAVRWFKKAELQGCKLRKHIKQWLKSKKVNPIYFQMRVD